ncbi:IGS10 protein, partial [Cochlearius cochlearius]|nr:IGS10 protein [Cochlearius cochlearius]
EDGRIIVVKTGTFTLRTADTFDTGLYHCIGTNYNDADTLTFRIIVVDPYVERNSVNGAQLSTFVGSTLYLPCTSTAVPDAAISWVLPEHAILHHSARNKHIFDNGTLRIQGVTERDSGYFRCVAANQYGVDLLVFQVLVRKDKTTLKKKHIAVGEWEEGDGSGNAMLASATRQKHPLTTPATLTANQESAASASRNRVTQSSHKRNSYGKITYRHYRGKISRRFRGHRRQFVSSARRVDPQRWAAFLEKTRRNLTLIEKRGEVAIKPPIQVRKFSEVPGDEEETSGDLISPEEEFMIPVTETATLSTLGRAMESVVTPGPEMTASNPPPRKTSLLVAEAVTPLPSPLSQSVSSDSSRPQTYLKPTVTNSWERSDISQISANGIKQSSVSNGASRTSTHFPAGQRLVHSGERNNQHFKSVSVTSVTDATDTSKSVTSQNAADKLHVFTESIDKISTRTDHHLSVATVSEPSPEFGHIYFHSAQKQVTPKPPLDSTIIAHQQIQIIQDVTTHTPQAQQQYGRRRKLSGRRRIVRPGRIPSMKEHRYNFARPGSVRGSTLVTADVQLNTKYASNLPTLNNLSSSINPFSPEAPLFSPSTMNMPSEHPAGTHQNTAFLGEGKNKASARQKATTVMPLITKGTQDTPQWKLETSAPFQTNTDRVQPFHIRRPTMTIHTAHMTTEIAHTVSTKTSSTLELVSPSIKPRTSEKNSQRGKITWEHLFGNGAQKEVLLQELPNQQTEMFLSTEVSTMLPKTVAALPVSKMSPLHFMPISTGGNHSRGFLSLNKPIHYSNGTSEEHLPTAKPQSYSNPATSANKETDVTSLKPTVVPIIAPQTDSKITRSKTFRVGRKRGQRRKRPPKTSPSQSVTAGPSTAAIPSVNTATPVVTRVKSLTMPTSLTSAKPFSEGVSTVSATETPAPWILNAPEAPRQAPTAATQTSATPVTRRNIPSAVLPPDSRIAQSPTTTIQTTPRLSKPFSTTSTRPATVRATSGTEPAQQIKATTTAGEKSHPKMRERVIQENHAAQPTFPARMTSSTRAPAATTDLSPSARHPTPLP